MTIPLLPMPITNNTHSHKEEDNIGIVAMQLYFPNHYIEQSELEKSDEVSTGKYTVGLGQEKMAFCFSNEDAISMALTVVQDLLNSYHVSPNEIGRIEVGTESNPDRSKSIKTHIVGLYPQEWRGSGGSDCLNACYGGTAAMLNSLNWIESKEWNGKYALVVMTDVAEYGKESPARPTGGAGAVAMLLGKNAPLVVHRERIVYHCEDVYDFYKPNNCDYPIVDGALSIQCYLNALRECATKYLKADDEFDYVIMHSPYCKLIQKGCTVLDDITGSSETWQKKAKLGLRVCRNVGNMYTAAMYAALASVLTETAIGSRILAFSYGSGLISCMFKFQVRSDVNFMAQAIRLSEKLGNRIKCSVQEYDDRYERSNVHIHDYYLLSEADGKRRYGKE